MIWRLKINLIQIPCKPWKKGKLVRRLADDGDWYLAEVWYMMSLLLFCVSASVLYIFDMGLCNLRHFHCK